MVCGADNRRSHAAVRLLAQHDGEPRLKIARQLLSAVLKHCREPLDVALQLTQRRELCLVLRLFIIDPVQEAEMIYAKGIYSSDKNDFVSKYPGLPIDPEAEDDAETQLLNKLRFSPKRDNIQDYQSLKSYIVDVVGETALSYLRDMTRYRGDFEYDLSASSYLDWLDEEWDTCCEASYPVGGMSAIIRGMTKKIEASGARIFLGEPVNTIDSMGRGYKLETSKKTVHVEELVIAVPPHALKYIGGEIMDKIQSSPEFKAMKGIKVTTITQWFDTPWWRDIKKLNDGKQVWRAWTTGHCINAVEIPQERYVSTQFAIRTVYNDQRECAAMWADLSKDPAAMDRELKKGLEHLFGDNGYTTPVTIPDAIKTQYWEWPDAWYWLDAGNRLTNTDVFNWAADPIEGEKIGLVSDGYNPQRTAWTDGAIKSAINLLEVKYGFENGGQPLPQTNQQSE